jgi:NAD dependent epimerase/dehydratase family enzyme
MKVVITGASGLIGSYLCSRYIQNGHEVIALTRSVKKFPLIEGLSNIVEYNYLTNILPKSINNTDLVINLTGKNIVTLWTRSNKQIIYDSRIKSTKYLIEGLSRLSTPPKMLASASAIGY